MNTALTGILITMGVYLFGMIIIGALFSKKNETAGDFYLGGRKLGPFVTAMSAEASDMSSWLLMGLPGVAYLSGIADAAWTAIGLAIGTYINWLIVAKRIRIYTYKANNSITIPDFFTNRYRDQDKKNILMLIAAAVIIIFFIPYTASGFSACGKLFATLFGVNYQLAMVVSAVVIVLYTCLGGFSAASTTDFIQSIVMSIALIIVVVFGVNVAGGMDAVMANASALPGYLSLTAMHDSASGTATSYGFITICSTLAWGFGYFGMPHILLRFMAIEDENKLPMARRVGSIWVVISMAVAIFIGVVGYSVSKVGAVP
ncbi:MAG: sodium/proline symporter, partial [Lachnospiraceae bacterium]|nr:sodium/proline symporter [Lachnospiraceae bacterium]